MSILLACLAAPAQAQVGVSASLTSDYRFRGLSLSDRKPALSVSVSYDHASGVYLGASVIGADTARSGLQIIGYQEYVGYAGHGVSGLGWDVGVSNANFTEYFSPRYNINYTEIYAGIVTNNISSHIYYSPNYLGEGAATIYVDVDGAIRPAPGWRLFAHVGVLAPLGGRDRTDFRGPQYDLRAGVATEFKGCEFQLAWTSVGPDNGYLADHTQARDALVLSATYFF